MMEDSLEAGSPATYALLGLLATRSWTGYELTQQVGRSLRFVWPTSEGHLYREQKRLVEFGWATVEEEDAGRRTRKRYAITDAGRDALRSWLATNPRELQLHIEGMLRAFFADTGDATDLAASLVATAETAGAMQDELLGFVEEYLEDGGPLTMLERGVGGPGARLDFHGRPMFPERLHVVAVAIDGVTQLLSQLRSFCETTAAEVSAWPTTTDPSLSAQTRSRLERVLDRSRRRASSDRPA